MKREREPGAGRSTGRSGASRRRLLGTGLFVLGLAGWFVLPALTAGLGVSEWILEVLFVGLVLVPIGALVLGGRPSEPDRRPNYLAGLVVAVVCTGLPLALALLHPSPVRIGPGRTLDGPEVAVVAVIAFAVMFGIGAAASTDTTVRARAHGRRATRRQPQLRSDAPPR